jgi:hypothetical protein
MKCLFLYLLIFLSIVFNATAQTRWYVDINGTSNGGATSWATACNDLQLVINNASAGDTIWVAQGTFKPIRPANNLNIISLNNRDNAFVLKANVHIFGGFTGTETNISQRDWKNNPAVLSGDIGTLGDSSDNCYHVVIASNTLDTATTLDGFTITGGYANGLYSGNDTISVNTRGIYRRAGGGLYTNHSSALFSNINIEGNMGGSAGMYNNHSSPILTNVSIYNNRADNSSINSSYSGTGGIHNDYSSPVLTNVSIYNNTASGSVSMNYFGGGGMSNYYSSPVLTNVRLSKNKNYPTSSSSLATTGGGMSNLYSSPVLTNVVIDSNIAGCGGGMYNYFSSPVLTNVRISYNVADSAGRATFVQNDGGGGILNDGHSSPVLTNVVICHNISLRALGGGGILNYGNSFPVLTNVTIASNKGLINGGISNYRSPNSEIRNCIVWGNTLLDGTTSSNVDNNNSTPVYANSLVEGITATGIISNSDPLFVDAANGNFRLSFCSPAINVGDNAFYSPDSIPDLSGITTDLDSNLRIESGIVDLGAYEHKLVFVMFNDSVEQRTKNICPGDTVTAFLVFTGNLPWEFIYTKDNGTSYDTVKSIGDSLYHWKLHPLDTICYHLVQLKDNNCTQILMDSIQINVIKPVFTNALSHDTLCSGEQTQPVTFTGTTVTDYQWIASGDIIDSIPTGIQSLPFGEYTVINKTDTALTSLITLSPFYKENGLNCKGKDTTFSITVFAEPKLTTILPNDTLCSRDNTSSVNFSGTGNEYEWIASGDEIDGIPTGIQTGNFEEYTVENKGDIPLTSFITVTPLYMEYGYICRGMDTGFSILVLPEPSISNVLQDDTLCNGERTKPIVFTGADQFEWTASGTVQGLPVGKQTGNFGSYLIKNETTVPTNSTVTIIPYNTINGVTCEGSRYFFNIIASPPPEIFSFTTNKHIFCEGEELQLEVSASGGYLLSYQWYLNETPISGGENGKYIVPSVSSSQSGRYYVKVSGYCGDRTSDVIGIRIDKDSILVEKWDDVLLVDNSSESYFGYQWYKDGIMIPGATNQFYQELGGLNGCYKVNLTLKSGKKEMTCERCLDNVKSVLKIYPNPTHSQLTIDNGQLTMEKVEIFDISGRMLQTFEVLKTSKVLDISHLSNGIYLVKVKTEAGEIVRKVVKE